MPCFGLLSTHLLSSSGTASQLSLLSPRGSCGNWHVTDDRCRHVSSAGNTSLPSISYLTTVKPTSLVDKCSWCAGFVVGDEVRAECGGRTGGYNLAWLCSGAWFHSCSGSLQLSVCSLGLQLLCGRPKRYPCSKTSFCVSYLSVLCHLQSRIFTNKKWTVKSVEIYP